MTQFLATERDIGWDWLPRHYAKLNYLTDTIH